MMKKSLSRNSESSTQFDSPHSPFQRFYSPMRSLDGVGLSDSPEHYGTPEKSPEKPDNSKAIVVADKFTQRFFSKSTEHQKQPENAPSANQPPSSMTVLNLSRREEPPRPVMKVSGGGNGGLRSPVAAGWQKEEAVRKAALGFRLSEVVVCLISFSVMAADRTQGWSGDSFDRYKEYRYCLSVNVIAFAYSGLQACDLACQLVTGKHMISHHLRYHFDFFMDQVLSYLLISASSSAATRVDDWQSNWGKDEFTEMASASVIMAFLAFIAFAISSLISGYILCTRSSM